MALCPERKYESPLRGRCAPSIQQQELLWRWWLEFGRRVDGAGAGARCADQGAGGQVIGDGRI